MTPPPDPSAPASSAPPAELRPLHESTVAKPEIDHLGHLNVRFYAMRALRATKALGAELGITREYCAAQAAELFVGDVFTRHYKEQLLGSKLLVRGGVLSAEPASLRIYHELVNVERGDLAATFVHRVQLQKRATREAVDFPASAVERASGAIVAWPEHGRPRSINLDAAPTSPGLELLRSRNLAMREVRTVREDHCDTFGFLQPSAYMDLLWGGQPTPEQADEFLYELENGHRFGWATMESRGCMVELPRLGSRVQSFGAEVQIGRKTSHRHQWLIDADRDRLLFRFSMLNLAFDINARGSVEIPPHIRREMEERYCPDLL